MYLLEENISKGQFDNVTYDKHIDIWTANNQINSFCMQGKLLHSLKGLEIDGLQDCAPTS